MPSLEISAGTTLIDCRHLGYEKIIAVSLLETRDGFLLIDPGPASSWPNVTKAIESLGLDLKQLQAILLTHIHLDHAGATGTIVLENPGLQVWVHERGARHLVNPARLLKSAGRLYEEDLQRLWGEVLPVPEENVTALKGGERVEVGKRRLDVAYTPGHAWHHVSFYDPRTGLAFVGDTAGIKIENVDYVIPAAPPPDIDLEAWDKSLEQILSWEPSGLVLTHFGLSSDAKRHICELRRHLNEWSDKVRRQLDTHESDEELVRRFSRELHREFESVLAETDLNRYELGAGVEWSWFGLARYWRLKEGREIPAHRRPDKQRCHQRRAAIDPF